MVLKLYFLNAALTTAHTLCYGARLIFPLGLKHRSVLNHFSLRTIFGRFCHELYFVLLAVYLSLPVNLAAQTFTPALPAPPAPVKPSPNVNQRVAPPRPNMPGPEDVVIQTLCTEPAGACTQEKDGPWYRLRGMARVETTDMLLRADEIDYNEDTGEADARGHVQFENFATGEKLLCDRAQYNIDEKTGSFYEVSGSAPARIEARPGILTTSNPFYFEGKWAERIKDEYIVHDGFVTDCRIPRPWWRFRASSFNIIPGHKATARRGWFYFRNLPLLYMPFFYKSLEKQPRRSGLLTPNIGHSSLRGLMLGAGYYWAINRSYDLTYRLQYFSNVGINHTVDFRGKVNEDTDFNFTLYALNDNSSNPSISTGGYQALLDGKSILGNGWEARGHLDLLSSFTYRQEFTESLNEAIFSETHSVGYLTKHWSDYGFNFVAERDQNFLGTTPETEGQAIETRKLPEAELVVREHEFRDWPLWFSLESSIGLDYRTQPEYTTRQFMNRTNFEPRATTALHWRGINVMPSFTLHETFYDSSLNYLGPLTPGKLVPQLSGSNLTRTAPDVRVDLALPSLERVFDAPSWMGKQVKHVIEPRVDYRYVTGIDDFNNIIRFDSTDILSNTNEVEFSLTNRLLAKDKNGTITDLLSWQVWYKRFFDPTFGGAVIPGQFNMVESVADLTGYSFLDGYRHQSPIVSDLRIQHARAGLEWRTDYDLVRHGFVNSSVTVDGRFSQVGVSVGHTMIRTDPVLLPNSNQLRASVTYGSQSRRGWNYGLSAFYDYRTGTLNYTLGQVTYNTDCCGISVQYRRFNFGVRNENQYLVSFAVSNIGTFGSLKRQDRIF